MCHRSITVSTLTTTNVASIVGHQKSVSRSVEQALYRTSGFESRPT
jgi:hypothetical protein